MGRKLAEVLQGLPATRKAAVDRLAQQKIEEMIAHAQTLTDFRKAVGKTQTQVAQALGIKQHAVSQLEQRSDTYVSTLRKFLESLGMRLELSVITSSGVKIDLPNFHPWAQDPLPSSSKKKTLAGKQVSKPVKRRRPIDQHA